jgi:hypothetical protein
VIKVFLRCMAHASSMTLAIAAAQARATRP